MREFNELEIERLMMSADALIEEEKVPEAKEVLIEVLCEDPTYAKAHNHLGWIYTHVIVNLVKAEEHFKLALKYAEGFPAVYSNYAIFLLEANKLDELIL
jgi:Tfp pilus assembly protein PilF